MAKVKAIKTVYRCQSCGHNELKWLGRCPTCQEWSSMVEELDAQSAPAPRPSATGVSDGHAPVPITEVDQIN
ncbi:MAG: DNA repair protein RadA, partial [Deltaproteobacteria bacterium]|nr:DNA repair protein RadA [Deltaproteobacteria bacterium]